jgi:2-methylcitrate dehydratase PrpD
LTDSVTGEVSHFIVGAVPGDVPAEVAAAAKRSILDGLGLAVAGSRTDVARIGLDQVRSYRTGSPEAALLGTATRLPARFAAFLNGIGIHADDYDDTQLAVLPDRVYGLLTHPTAPVLPATLALAEKHGADGATLLMSYLVGVEVETKVSEAIAPRHYHTGFHSTGTVGAIGAAAGAARLLGLDPTVTATALGIAASQAAGLRESFGTMTKPFHAGRAAEAGVLAAELAADGQTAATNILEARRGFFEAAGGGWDPDAISGRLAAPWTFASPGVSIKPYPSGSLTHPAMTAMVELIEEHDIKASDVEQVTVGTNRNMPNALIYPKPTTDLEAKFSMQFCMAILLLERRAGLAEFTDEVVNRPDVQSLLDRVRLEVDPEAEAAGYDLMTSIVRVRLKDGRTLESRCSFSRGQPSNPMTDDELAAKFAECLGIVGIPESSADEAMRRILALEEQESLAPVLQALTTEGRAR